MYTLILAIWIPLVILFLAWLYFRLTFWTRQGIPTDRSSRNGIPFHVSDVECHRKYGKVVGFHEGLRPSLSITDPQLIRQVLVAQFHSFVNHRDLAAKSEPISHGLFLSKYPQWKRIRTTLSPSFTTGRLKAMGPTISDTLGRLCAKLDLVANRQQVIDLRQLYDTYTFDVISRTAAGCDTNAINNPGLGNQLFHAVRNMFQTDQGLRDWIAFYFPFVRYFINVPFFNARDLKVIEQSVTHVIDHRLANNIRVPDFLQHTIDASVLADKYDHANMSIKNTSFNKLSNDEVVGQAVNIFAAGLETTASQLLFMTRLLALEPNHHSILVKEIQETFPEIFTTNNKDLANDDNQDINYDKLLKMPYLDAFVKEVMRVHCSVSRVDRVTTSDTYLNGIYLPKGTPIIIPIWALHYDADHFTDPDQFKPERFLGDNEKLIQPYTYLPFATGPRNCIGMRFAMLEMKYTLVKLLIKYEFESCPETKEMDYFCPLIQLASLKRMLVKIKHRDNVNC